MGGDLRARGTWAELETGGGIAGQTMMATPFGMRSAQDLRIGDPLRASSGGPVCVVSIAAAPSQGWIRLPPLSLGNRQAIVIGQGQSLLIESAYAQTITGSTAVVVPALALRFWRGILPCAAPDVALRITLSRPALIVGSAGLLFAADGPANAPLGTGDLPPVPSLSFESARQLVACLIAYEAGAMLRGLRPQAAVF
jgi:hypothetical protein